jgi:hypothetical protein
VWFATRRAAVPANGRGMGRGEQRRVVGRGMAALQRGGRELRVRVREDAQAVERMESGRRSGGRPVAGARARSLRTVRWTEAGEQEGRGEIVGNGPYRTSCRGVVWLLSSQVRRPGKVAPPCGVPPRCMGGAVLRALCC